jgi:hypothetical protein
MMTGNLQRAGGCLILLLTATILHAADARQDSLWKKAVAVAGSNAHWVAGLTIMRSEVFHKGEREAVHELWKRSKPDASGKVITETIKVLEDGEDVTEAEKKKTPDKKANPGPGPSGPFAAAVQDQLSLKTTSAPRVIAGRNCVGYLFEVKNTNGPTINGTAWLDGETGAPAEIENMTLTPNPEKRLKAMSTTIHYETTADGAWHVKEMITTASVTVFFITATVRNVTSFSEYWKKVPAIVTGLGK